MKLIIRKKDRLARHNFVRGKPVVGGGGGEPSGPNPGKSYVDLNGAPPSILLSAWKLWAESLKNKRLANVPLERSTKYYFSAAGADDNDGSLDNPWLTLDRANAVAAPLSGTLINNNQLTVADSSDFDMENQSWWMGDWIKTPADGNYYAPIFTRTDSYGLLVGKSGADKNTPRVMTNGTEHVVWGAPLIADTWAFVEAWFDTTTREISICVDNGTPVSATKASQFSATANPLHVGAGGW